MTQWMPGDLGECLSVVRWSVQGDGERPVKGPTLRQVCRVSAVASTPRGLGLHFHEFPGAVLPYHAVHFRRIAPELAAADEDFTQLLRDIVQPL